MKSVKKTVTSGQFNTDNEILVEVIITDENSRTRIPQEVIIVNSVGVDVAIIYLDDDAERELRIKNPEYFDFFPIASGRSSGELPASIQYIIVKKVNSGDTATGNLDMYFLAHM